MTANRGRRGADPRRGIAAAAMCAVAIAASLAAGAIAPHPSAPAQIAGCSWRRAGELPLAVYDAAGAVDAVAGQLVVHGGIDRDGAVRDEVYRLDLRSDEPPVERLSTTGANVRRWGHTLTWVLDGQRSRFFAIGGNAARGDDEPADSRVFTLDAVGNRWQPVTLTGGSLGLQDHAAAYDPVHRVVVVHGGRTNSGRDDIAEPRDATFFVDVGANHILPGPRGPKLYSHSLVWDAAGQRMLAFGGTPDGQRGSNAVYALHLGNGPGLAEWSTLTVGGTPPGPRFNHGAALDLDRKAMVVYGGLKGLGEPLMDTWALDLSKPGVATWVDLDLANAKRSGMVMHYNPLRRLTLQISGGRPLSPESTKDIFALRCAEVGPTLPPPGTVVLPPSSPSAPAETVILPTERTPTPTGTPPTGTATIPGTPRPTETASPTPTPGPGTILPPPLTVAATATGTTIPIPTPTPGPGTVLPPPQTVAASATPTGAATPTGSPAPPETPTPTATGGTVPPPATAPPSASVTPSVSATDIGPSTSTSTTTAIATATETSTATVSPSGSPSATPATPISSSPTPSIPTPPGTPPATLAATASATPSPLIGTSSPTSTPTGSPPIATAPGPTTPDPPATATTPTSTAPGSTTPDPHATSTVAPTADPERGRKAWLPYLGLARLPATSTARPPATTQRPEPTTAAPSATASPSRPTPATPTAITPATPTAITPATPTAITPATPTAITPTAMPNTPTATAIVDRPTPSPTPCLVAEEEPNDAILDALDRPPLCRDRAATGSLPPGDASDHWRLEAPAAGLVSADLSDIPDGTNYDLYLYTRQGQLLGISQRPGTEAEHVEARVPSGGDYYVRVYASVGRSEVPYEVRWGWGP